MPIFAVNGLIGAVLDNAATNADIRTAAQVTAGNQPHRNGQVAYGSDGAKYVYGKTANSVSADARQDYVFSTGLITTAAAGALINKNAATIESGGAAWFRAVQNYTAAAGITTAAPPG
jgi:hypothetical protein